MKEIPTLPNAISTISHTLHKAGYMSYLVGGCVRDLLLNTTPKDWDITTNATPEEIIALFEHTYYANTFGTVGVVTEENEDSPLHIIEVTTFRKEGKYNDKRRPSEVIFCDNIEEDLKRRDFTINTIAYNIENNELYDPHNGISDIAQQIIRAVGNPTDRFNEDALRLLRAIRIANDISFTIEEETKKAIITSHEHIKDISKERIRDEFTKIILSKQPQRGIEMLYEYKLLSHIIPELEEGIGCKQNGVHKYDVFEHLMRTVQHSADKNFILETRLAALLHDIGKPQTREFSKEKNDYTFYNHEVVGATVAYTILSRLAYPKKVIKTVVALVRNHMFFTETETITLSAVRRLLAKVGKDTIWHLMDVRKCDRVGIGRPKEEPYRLRKFMSMIEEVIRDPISVSMLAVDGTDIIALGEDAGPRIGHILHALFAEVLVDPTLNTKEYLTKKITELQTLSDNELIKRGAEGRVIKEEKEEEELQQLRKKRGVS